MEATSAGAANGSEAAPGARRQPAALRVLFMTEACERFGYYVMVSIFTLYLTEELKMPELAGVPGLRRLLFLCLSGDGCRRFRRRPRAWFRLVDHRRGGAHGRGLLCARLQLFVDGLRGARPSRRRHGLLQGQCLGTARTLLRRRRPSPVGRLHHFLYGHQCGSLSRQPCRRTYRAGIRLQRRFRLSRVSETACPCLLPPRQALDRRSRRATDHGTGDPGVANHGRPRGGCAGAGEHGAAGKTGARRRHPGRGGRTGGRLLCAADPSPTSRHTSQAPGPPRAGRGGGGVLRRLSAGQHLGDAVHRA